MDGTGFGNRGKDILYFMFRNYLITAIRNFNRSKWFSIVNILGLSTGLATVFIIFLYIYYETGYDRVHTNGDRIYRQIWIGKEYNTPIQPGIFLQYQRNELKGVDAVTMLMKRQLTVKAEDKVMGSQDFIIADSLLFSFFDWKSVNGNPAEALRKPGTVVLTQSAAKKYFGNVNPIGKVMLFENSYHATVSAIIADVPQQSFIHFLGILPLNYSNATNTSELHEWGNSSYNFFCMVNSQSSLTEIEAGLFNCWKKNSPWGASLKKNHFRLQPLRDIHLRSEANRWEIEPQGSITTVRILGITAILILLLACINFVNLSTARNSKRYREIGLRKVVGSQRSHIIIQFLFETAFYISISLLLALMISELLLPWFSNLAGVDLQLGILFKPEILIVVLILLLLLIGLAGSYPAFVLSAPEPAVVLRKHGESFKINSHLSMGLREVLVIVQFFVSVGLITGAIIVQKQLDFFSESRLGFESHQKLVIVNPWDDNMTQRLDALTAKLKQMPEVKAVTASHNVPGQFENNYASFFIKGSDPKKQSVQAAFISVENHFFEVMNSSVLRGEGFPGVMSQKELDSFPSCVVNETFAKQLDTMGAGEIIGRSLNGFYSPISTRKIIGVVNDIHFRSLHDKVMPAVFIVSKSVYPNYNLNILVDIDSHNMPGTMKKIESEWQNITKDWPFNSFFLDQRYASQYKSEQNLSVIIRAFTAVALIISLLGLLALVMFVSQLKRKEIGIRKVLGADYNRLVRMMSWRFVKLVLIADVLAVPSILWLCSYWLSGFAYHIEIGWFIPLAVIFISLLLTFTAIFWQTWRAIAANPVDVLKTE